MTFHFDKDLQLTTLPLIEAWLEIQWDTHATGNTSTLSPNLGFDFALGLFANSIKPEFPEVERLEAAQFPDHFAPELVRYQFRSAPEAWPVIQIGSGVATVNFVNRYNWITFQEKASYLRRHLLDAYSAAGSTLKGKLLILRYRNAEPVDYTEESLQDFLHSKLNTTFELPEHIPGAISRTDRASSIDIRVSFELNKPQSTGSLQFVTGIRNADQAKLLVWEISIAAMADEMPPLDDEKAFVEWLTEAHEVVHEWFFALIEGPLREKYN